jgi:hypothetical protein
VRLVEPGFAWVRRYQKRPQKISFGHPISRPPSHAPAYFPSDTVQTMKAFHEKLD